MIRVEILQKKYKQIKCEMIRNKAKGLDTSDRKDELDTYLAAIKLLSQRMTSKTQ